MNTNIYAYLFELRSIQDYLFASGKLSDTVAASDLLDQVTESLLTDALTCCSIVVADASVTDSLLIPKDKVMFARRAGGAIYMLSADITLLRRFMAYWSLIIPQLLPNVEYIHCITEGENAFNAVANGTLDLAQKRNQPKVNFQYATSPVMLSPRTGKAVVRQERNKGKEWLDAATSIQRYYNEAELGTDQSNNLTTKFEPENETGIEGRSEARIVWPVDFESTAGSFRFPLNESDNYIALVHIDGNGLGQLLMKLKDFNKKDSDYCALYSRFSAGLTAATQLAAQKATQAVLVPNSVALNDGKMLMPARPIVLGGDDLTIIIRADLAIAFSQHFIAAFEAETTCFLEKLLLDFDGNQKPSLPKTLTASGGIAFVKSSHPFIQAHDLAESLTKYAKDQSRSLLSSSSEIMSSSLSFFRVTSNSSKDYNQIINDELTTTIDSNTGRTYQFTLGAYGTGRNASAALPKLTNLLSASQNIKDSSYMSSGKLREIETLIHTNYVHAKSRLERIRTLAENNGSDKAQYQQAKSEIESVLMISADESECFAKGDENGLVSPIGDILTVLSVNNAFSNSIKE